MSRRPREAGRARQNTGRPDDDGVGDGRPTSEDEFARAKVEVLITIGELPADLDLPCARADELVGFGPIPSRSCPQKRLPSSYTSTTRG